MPIKKWFPLSLIGRGCLCFSLLLTGLISPALGRPDEPPQPADAAAVRALIEKVGQFEARLSAVEAENAQLRAMLTHESETNAVKPATPASQETQPAPQVTDMGHAGTEGSTNAIPRLQIRGFSDVRYTASNLRGTTNSFVLGQFNLFITSRLSDRFSTLAEVVTEADSANNNFSIELERMMLQYKPSDLFQLGIGRYHTSIGFYNTAYHHSTWLQTTVDRPFLFEFEDGGGILPIHSVGVVASGSTPAGGLGLHYVAELANGRAVRTKFGANPVQNVADENNGKAFNLALFSRPEAVPGLQVGFSGYHDHLTPSVAPNVDEWILAAHAIYQKPNFELLNEMILMRHSPADGTPTVNSLGFYSQISSLFGKYRPYFRYEYVNVPDRDLIYPDVHRINGPLFGLRYNWSEFAAFKIQYGRSMRRQQPSFNTLTLQTSFAF